MFAVVNVAVLVLRRDPVEHRHFTTPTVLPVVGIAACIYLVLPWTSGRAVEQYGIAAVLLVIGIALWAVTFIDRRVRGYAHTASVPDRTQPLDEIR